MVVSLGGVTLLAASAGPVPGSEGRSFFTLPTGNGHGFQLFDANAGRVSAFLDHPYRFTRAPKPPEDLRTDGPERRNLLERFELGLADADGATDWLTGSTTADPSYVDQSNIIAAPARAGRRDVERYLFSPFGLELNAAALVMRAPGAGAANHGVADLGFHLGGVPKAGRYWEPPFDIVKLPGERLRALDGPIPAWIETGQGTGAMIYVPLVAGARVSCVTGSAAPTPVDGGGGGGGGGEGEGEGEGEGDCAAADLSARLEAPLDADGWFGVLVAYVEDPAEAADGVRRIAEWVGSRAPGRILADSRAEFEAWRRPPPVRLDETVRRIWRQSESVLRMAQVREPDRPAPHLRTNHGMVLASLAPGHWTTGWVRDGAYATVALARSGHFAEARDSLRFFLNAAPVGKYADYLDGIKYRISVTRYFGDGEEEADYSGQATPNVETDGWGLVLWAMRQYVELSGDTAFLDEATREGSVYAALRDEVAGAIAKQLEPVAGAADGARIMRPDSSIWEVHDENKKHFAFTTLTAARGLCDFAWLAGRAREREDSARYRVLARQVQRGFARAFGGAEGYVLGALERAKETDHDAAVLEAFGLDVWEDPRGELARRTLDELSSKLALAHGGFKRNGGDDSYSVNEWVFVDFRMANALRRSGRLAEAASLIARLTARTGDNFGLFPEMYNDSERDGPVGHYLGSNPMVGYGSGAFILSVLDREGSFGKTDCGTD